MKVNVNITVSVTGSKFVAVRPAFAFLTAALPLSDMRISLR